MKLIHVYTIATALTFSALNIQAQDDTTSYENSDESWMEEDSWGDSESADPWGSANDESKTESKSPAVNFVNSCTNRNDIRDKAKEALLPYRYCAGKTSTLTFKRYPQQMELIIPIYYDQQHVLVFNTEGLDQNILIRVYDKPLDHKRKEVLFEVNGGEKQSLFELPKDYKESKIFIEYVIPPYNGEKNMTSKGCVVFMMGYLDEKFMDLASEASKVSE